MLSNNRFNANNKKNHFSEFDTNLAQILQIFFSVTENPIYKTIICIKFPIDSNHWRFEIVLQIVFSLN